MIPTTVWNRPHVLLECNKVSVSSLPETDKYASCDMDIPRKLHVYPLVMCAAKTTAMMRDMRLTDVPPQAEVTLTPRGECILLEYFCGRGEG